jgi:putative transposase
MSKRSHHHAVYKLTYHLVLVTKYRHKVITPEILARLEHVFTLQCARWEVKLIEFNGESDHVHLLIEAHPSMEMAKFINSIKTVSSRLIRKEYKEHLAPFYWKPYFWSRAYCLVSTGGAPLDIVQKYIQNQDRPT